MSACATTARAAPTASMLRGKAAVSIRRTTVPAARSTATRCASRSAVTSASGAAPPPVFARACGASARAAAPARNCLRSTELRTLARVITSRDNPKLRLVRRLHGRAQRQRLGLFVCEGEDVVDAGLAAGLEPVELLRSGEDVAPELLAEVSTLGHPPRVLAVFRSADLPRSCSGDHRVVLGLWRVADPGNLGTLIRSADAFGACVAVSRGCADPTAPKALRAAAGAGFRVPLVPLDGAPGRRVALAAHGGRPLAELAFGEEPTLFLLGAEREGLPDELLRSCDEIATIPTPGPAESLNVAAAGAIALYAWSVAATGGGAG